MRQGIVAQGVLREGILKVPSVDLASLRSQAIELADRLEDPGVFRASLRALMEQYAHRLLRRGRSMDQHGALPAWEVPGLLIREVQASLRLSAQNRPNAALAAAGAVWAEGKFEEKLLAAYLAGFSRDSESLQTLLSRWLEGLEDPAVLRALSVNVCLPIGRANPVHFRSRLRTWLESPAPSVRRFGWMALNAWQDEGSSEAIFAAFDLLPMIFSETDPEAVRLAANLLVHLSKKAPQETRGWLEELTPKNASKGRRFFRAAIPSLPPELAALIRSPRRER
jgi:hypothetical protein